MFSKDCRWRKQIKNVKENDKWNWDLGISRRKTNKTGGKKEQIQCHAHKLVDTPSIFWLKKKSDCIQFIGQMQQVLNTSKHLLFVLTEIIHAEIPLFFDYPSFSTKTNQKKKERNDRTMKFRLTNSISVLLLVQQKARKQRWRICFGIIKQRCKLTHERFHSIHIGKMLWILFYIIMKI